MDIGPGADATLLERALQGEPVDDEHVLELLAVAQAVRGLDQPGLRPRAAFVAGLRERLLDEASEIATGAETPAPDSTDETRATVVRLPHRTLRLVGAVAASLLLVAGLLGVLSRSAVPGDALYPVKQLLDRAAVALSGSRLDEGRTHLAQAQQHISEARDLLDRGDVVPADLSVAFDGASDSVVAADTILRDVYATEGRPEALTDLADFLTRARPQVDAMDSRVPGASRPAYQRLRQLLRAAEVRALREVAACGQCGDAANRARAALATLGLLTSPAQAGKPTAAPALPGATVAVPSLGISSNGATLGGGGATLPGATLNLPSVGLTTSAVELGGGGVTLPGATVSLPGVTLQAPTSTSLPLSPTLLP